MNIIDKYLPLGSIVLINGNVKKLMIVARGVVSGGTNKKNVFDYGSVLYPEGIIDDRLIFFNHDDIYKIVSEGYSDDDDIIMNENIKKFLSEVKKDGANTN